MPNWCANRLEIFGPQEAVARLRAEVASSDSSFDFERILPTPEGMLNKTETQAGGFFPDWYGWRIANWGTKWNASDPSLTELPAPAGRACLRYDFSTAWSPPTPLFDHLAERHPELGLAVFFSDEQMNFIGHARWSNGRYIVGGSADDESAQNEMGQQIFGDAGYEEGPRVAPAAPEPFEQAVIRELAPRWEELLDAERVFRSERLHDTPTVRVRIEADASAQIMRGGTWSAEPLPPQLAKRVRRLSSRKGERIFPIEAELCEVARADAPGRVAVPGAQVTRLLLDLHEFAGQRLDGLPYAERRQLRADLAHRLVTPEGTCWFDLADPRLAEWVDARGVSVMSDHFETPLDAALPSGRRLVAS